MKILIAFIAALASAASLQAGPRLRVDAGYTVFNLGKVRADVEDGFKEVKAKGGSVDEDKVDHSAVFAELGLDFYLNDRLSLGPEIGYMSGHESSYFTDVTEGTLRTQTQGKYLCNLLPLSLRLGWDITNPRLGFYAGFDANLGIGIGYLSPGGGLHQEDSSIPLELDTHFDGENHSGVAPLAKAAVHGGYRFNGPFGLGASLGYRYATFSQLQDPNGRPLKNRKGDPLEVDLGGFEANLEMNFSF